MTIYERPQSSAFAADLQDYFLDNDSTISFAVKKGNKIILNEEYCPDATYGIRTRKLGRFCADALWGIWPTDTNTIQEKLADNFSFLINGTVDQSTFIVASRQRCHFTPVGVSALSLTSVKATRMGAKEWVTAIVSSTESIVVYATADDGSTQNHVLFSHGGPAVIVTVDVSPSRIAGLFPTKHIIKYSVCGLTFRIDQTQYADIYLFRYKNNFDCPEGLSATGSLTVRASNKSENAFMAGKERKFRLMPTDEFTVNSGVIFAQSDYKMWHELLNSRHVQMLVDGIWVDIIVTKSRYERNFKKNILKSVDFSFRFADPDDNSL